MTEATPNDGLVLLEDDDHVDEDEPDSSPIMVEDDKYSLEPTADREAIVDIFSSLAESIYTALEEDCKINHRYARRMLISNQNLPRQLQSSTGSDTPKTKRLKRAKREEILVVLPIRATSWNDLDSSDILLCLLCKIDSDLSRDYQWFNVRLHLDQFISERTKLLMDAAEQEDDDEDDEYYGFRLKHLDSDGQDTYLPKESQLADEGGENCSSPDNEEASDVRTFKPSSSLDSEAQTVDHNEAESTDNSDDDIEVIYDSNYAANYGQNPC